MTQDHIDHLCASPLLTPEEMVELRHLAAQRTRRLREEAELDRCEDELAERIIRSEPHEI